MNEEEIIKYAIKLGDTYIDQPFSRDKESIVLKHLNNNKWFGLIMKVNEEIYLNIKTTPEYSEILRHMYDYIIPAYHMNKEHWNTIIISKRVDKDLVKELIYESFELTK